MLKYVKYVDTLGPVSSYRLICLKQSNHMYLLDSSTIAFKSYSKY